jgi:hypothetical protein
LEEVDMTVVSCGITLEIEEEVLAQAVNPEWSPLKLSFQYYSVLAAKPSLMISNLEPSDK